MRRQEYFDLINNVLYKNAQGWVFTNYIIFYTLDINVIQQQNTTQMTGLIVLDVFIGLFFIYTLYSLFTTVIIEIINTNFQFRALSLKRSIQRMLNDSKNDEVFGEKFYKEATIKYLASGGLFNKPSYILSRNFSKAVIELLKRESNKPGIPSIKVKDTLENGLKKEKETSKFIHSLYQDANGDMIKFKVYLEEWFDDTMERATGWYKKWIQVITFVVGFAIALIFNVDTLKIVDKLSKDPKIREQYIQLASQLANNDNLHPETKTDLNNQLGKLSSLANESQHIISIERCSFWDVNFLGLFITAIALSLGAPFWFDLLNKVVRLRSSIPQASSGQSGGNKPNESNTSISGGAIPARQRKG